jgi:hypothetical protein
MSDHTENGRYELFSTKICGTAASGAFLSSVARPPVSSERTRGESLLRADDLRYGVNHAHANRGRQHVCFSARRWRHLGAEAAARPGPLEDPRPALGHESAVLSGEDIGIRLTGSVDASGRVQGTLVAKVSGKWVDVVTPTVAR